MTDYLFTTNEWSAPLMDKTWKVIDDYGRNWLGLEYNEPQFQITTADQMISAYASLGLPAHYSHWSLGKQVIDTQKSYAKGQSGLAYEMIINSDPAIAYMMENNTMTMMALTMAHAAVGHSSVNKMNYMFKEWTRPSFIIPYMRFAQEYIQTCEDKYGEEEVEWLLDRAHALKHHSLDRYRRGKLLTKTDRLDRYWELQKIRSSVQPTDFSIPGYIDKIDQELEQRYFESDYEARDQKYQRNLPEENILYFLEKQSPSLKTWQREILRIVRVISQYFYPQMEMKLVHEGWASFVHYTIMTQMWNDGHLTDGSYIEFLRDHVAVCSQPEGQPGMNPYKLGYTMFKDLKRVCQEPTKEDEYWFPDLCNTEWIPSLKEIMMNHKDQSFLIQYLSPNVIRELKLMMVSHADAYNYEVAEVHDDEGVWGLREALAKEHGLHAQRLPIVEVSDYSLKEQSCHIDVRVPKNMRIHQANTRRTLQYIEDLWGSKKCYCTVKALHDK